MKLVLLLKPQPLEHNNQLRRLKDELRKTSSQVSSSSPFEGHDKYSDQSTALDLQISQLLRLHDAAFREQFQPVCCFFELPETVAGLCDKFRAAATP